MQYIPQDTFMVLLVFRCCGNRPLHKLMCSCQRLPMSWWRHQTFSRNWPLVRRIHRPPVKSPHKGQWRGALMFSLVCVWINGWANNHEAGDLKRYRAHYDVTVMFYESGFNGTGATVLNMREMIFSPWARRVGWYHLGWIILIVIFG